MIGERFRRVFDPEDTGYIAQQTFLKTMQIACLGQINEKINMIFQMLDFDNDGYVCRDDVSALLLHVPLHEYNIYERSTNSSIPKDPTNPKAMQERQKSQDELHDMLIDCFKDDYITLKQFESVIVTMASDIFVSIFYILLTKFPTLSELYMFSTKETDSNRSNEISIKKSDLPPARRMSNLWPIKEIYLKKKAVDIPILLSERTPEKPKDDENIMDDIDEGGAKLVISSTFNSNDIKKIEETYTKQKTHREITLGFLQFNKNVIRSGSLRSGKFANTPNTESVLEKTNTLKQSTFHQIEEKKTINEIKKIPSISHVTVEDFQFKKSETIMECLYENNLIEGVLSELEGTVMEEYYYVLKGKTLYSRQIIRKIQRKSREKPKIL